MKILSSILIVIMLSGCAIPTVIKSNPEGAAVYINNIKKGNTPLTYSDTEILLSQKNIRLEMDGYKSFSSIIKKDKLKIGPLIGACFGIVPGLWALGYAEEYTIELERGHSPKANVISAPTMSISNDQPKMIQTQPMEQVVTHPVEKRSESSIAPQESTTSFVTFFVIESKAKLREKPSTKAKVVKNLTKGEEVQLIKQKDGWSLVELAGGETGWCSKGSLAQRF